MRKSLAYVAYKKATNGQTYIKHEKEKISDKKLPLLQRSSLERTKARRKCYNKDEYDVDKNEDQMRKRSDVHKVRKESYNLLCVFDLVFFNASIAVISVFNFLISPTRSS